MRHLVFGELPSTGDPDELITLAKKQVSIVGAAERECVINDLLKHGREIRRSTTYDLKDLAGSALLFNGIRECFLKRQPSPRIILRAGLRLPGSAHA